MIIVFNATHKHVKTKQNKTSGQNAMMYYLTEIYSVYMLQHSTLQQSVHVEEATARSLAGKQPHVAGS